MPIRSNPNIRRVFRNGLPAGPDGRERPVASMFPTITPGVYGPKNPSPFGFSLPSGYHLPEITPLTTTPVTASDSPTESLPTDAPPKVVGEDSPTGERLPLGKQVGESFDYRTGLYESVHTRPPAGMNPVGGPAAVQPPSRYTMATTPSPAGFRPGGDASAQEFGTNATALALQQIYSGGAGGPVGGAGGSAGGRGAATAQAGEMDDLGNTGRVLSAAAGLEGSKLQAAADVMNGHPTARVFNPHTGQWLDQGSNAPLGTTLRSDIEFSPYDTPEIRARKTAYAEQRIRAAAQADPSLATGGAGLDTGAMATVFHNLMKESGQPRLQNLGKDSEGRPVEGTVDRNGNFSRIAPEKKQRTKDDQPEYSQDGKFYRSGPSDDWKPLPASHDKPLSVTEWLMSGKPEGTYKAYRDAFQRESAAVPADNPVSKVQPAAAPAAAPAAPVVPPASASGAAPQAVYSHDDVLAELQRRGIKRK